MNKEDIEWILKFTIAPDKWSAEEINELSETLDQNPLGAAQRERVLNLLDQITIFDIARLRFSEEAAGFDKQYDLRLVDTCDHLFIDGYYGPCCIYIRSTLEYVLQEDCLKFLGASPRKTDIEIINKIKNPSSDLHLRDMVNALKYNGRWTDSCESNMTKIVSNGNAVVHHRYDLIKGPAEIENMIKGKPRIITHFSDGSVEIVMDDVRATEEFFRPIKERTMAKESLEALHCFVFERRAQKISQN